MARFALFNSAGGQEEIKVALRLDDIECVIYRGNQICTVQTRSGKSHDFTHENAQKALAWYVQMVNTLCGEEIPAPQEGPVPQEGGMVQ